MLIFTLSNVSEIIRKITSSNANSRGQQHSSLIFLHNFNVGLEVRMDLASINPKILTNYDFRDDIRHSPDQA